MTERWKEVKGFEGLYEISTHGRLKYVERYYFSGRNRSTKKLIKPDIMKQRLNKYGYYDVVLRNGKKRRPYEVHRLMGVNFLGVTKSEQIVNHLDTNKLNNFIDNFEVTDIRGNINHYQSTRDKACKSAGVYLSKYKGVTKGYITSITANGKRFYLGNFSTELQASDYYQDALSRINKGLNTIYAKKRKGIIEVNI